EARHQLRLVGLQMPDHRPVEIAKILHGLPLSIRLLRLVLAKFAAARSIGEAKARLGFRFTDRQQADRGGIAPGAGAGGGDTRLYGGKIALEVLDHCRFGPAPVLIMHRPRSRTSIGHRALLYSAPYPMPHAGVCKAAGGHLPCRREKSPRACSRTPGRSILAYIIKNPCIGAPSDNFLLHLRLIISS